MKKSKSNLKKHSQIYKLFRDLVRNYYYGAFNFKLIERSKDFLNMIKLIIL